LKVVSAGELRGKLVDNLKVHIWSGHAIGMVNIPPNVPDGNHVKLVGAKQCFRFALLGFIKDEKS
jgi:hypothetical protein